MTANEVPKKKEQALIILPALDRAKAEGRQAGVHQSDAKRVAPNVPLKLDLPESTKSRAISKTDNKEETRFAKAAEAELSSQSPNPVPFGPSRTQGSSGLEHEA